MDSNPTCEAATFLKKWLFWASCVVLLTFPSIYMSEYRVHVHTYIYDYISTCGHVHVLCCACFSCICLFLNLQIASKEGYLTKLGQHRKVSAASTHSAHSTLPVSTFSPLFSHVLLPTSPSFSHLQTWRTRWFVLFKNELKYYKSRQVDWTTCTLHRE